MNNRVFLSNNGNMSVNSQIREKLISEHGYHLSVDGVQMLASNLRNQVESILGIQGRNASVKPGG